MNAEQKKAYKEVLVIVNSMEDKYIEKIPKNLMNFFERNSMKNYNFNVDVSIPLKEHKLHKKTISLLAMLNLNYWCENEDEKAKLLQLYTENEKKYNEVTLKKYSFENSFKKEEIQIKSDNVSKKETLPIENKENFFGKIINKIKKIFKKNK